MSRTRKTHRASFGSVRKLPSGRYQARYTDQRMVTHNAPHTFDTKRAADDWLAGVRADMTRGTWRDPALGRMTVADYAATHLATRLDLSPVTRNRYDELLRTWIDTDLRTPPNARGAQGHVINLGRTDLGALNVATIREWHVAALHTSHARAQARSQRRTRSLGTASPANSQHAARRWALVTGRAVKPTGRLPRAVLDAWERASRPDLTAPAIDQRLAASTGPASVPSGPGGPGRSEAGRPVVAQAYRLVRMILNHAVVDGRIDANPCQIPGAGHVRTPERVHATVAQVDALAAAMPDRYAAAVVLAAWSGLRAGEILALARSHVDLDAGTLRVERAVIYLPGHPPYFGPPKTSTSRRTVAVPPHVLPILREHLDAYVDPSPAALIFTDEKGRIVPRETRLKAFARARNAVGLPKLHWHDLRHTGATLAAQSGASLRELQHRFGHSTTQAAMIYQHAEAVRDRSLAERMSLLATQHHDADVVEPHRREA